MSKRCNNPSCEAYGKPQEDDGIYCHLCGGKLVEDKPAKVIKETNVGADGISVSRVMNDSHDTISNNNTTIVLNGKSLEDLTLKERKASYRKFCSDVIENGIISPAVRKKLDLYALEMELSAEEIREIEKFVRKHSSATSFELNTFDRDNLDIIKANIAANQGSINDMLAKLEAMSSYDNDEVQFYYNMLLCISSPSVIIRKYEDREQDIYWLAFWVYVGFLKNGQRVKAEKALRELTVWDSQSQDNLHLLQATGALIGEDVDSAGIFLAKAKNTSYLLRPMSQVAAYIIKGKGQRKLSNSKEINFYLEKLYGLKDDSLVFTNETYVEPIHDAPRNKMLQSKDATIVSVTPQSYYPSLQPTATKPNKLSGKLIGIIAIAAIIVVVVLLIPQNKKPETAPVPATTSSTTQVTATSEESITPTNKTVTSSAPKKTTAVSSSSSGTPTARTSSSSTSTETAINSSNVKKAYGSTESLSSNNSETMSTNRTALASKSTPDPIAELKKAAEGGDKDAQYKLGMRYYEGNGVSKNMSTAFQYLKPLADAGYAKAYFPVADMYHRGQGVAKDRDAAEKWYQKAADAGNSKAKSILLNSF